MEFFRLFASVVILIVLVPWKNDERDWVGGWLAAASTCGAGRQTLLLPLYWLLRHRRGRAWTLTELPPALPPSAARGATHHQRERSDSRGDGGRWIGGSVIDTGDGGGGCVMDTGDGAGTDLSAGRTLHRNR
jgi:hypothetical protein